MFARPKSKYTFGPAQSHHILRREINHFVCLFIVIYPFSLYRNANIIIRNPFILFVDIILN